MTANNAPACTNGTQGLGCIPRLRRKINFTIYWAPGVRFYTLGERLAAMAFMAKALLADALATIVPKTSAAGEVQSRSS